VRIFRGKANLNSTFRISQYKEMRRASPPSPIRINYHVMMKFMMRTIANPIPAYPATALYRMWAVDPKELENASCCVGTSVNPIAK
jgi:hypothetical protein